MSLSQALKLLDEYGKSNTIKKSEEGARAGAEATEKRTPDNVIEFKNKSQLEDLKAEYNELIRRYQRAEKFMNCYHLKDEELKTAIKERERYIPELKKLINELDELRKKIEFESNKKMTSNEILQGF